MRRHVLPPARNLAVNVTPLIDIVMCLIIFFMLVARIGMDSGSDRQVTVPASFLGVDLKDLGNTLTLNITNGPNVVGGLAQPLVTCSLNGKLQEIRVRADANGQVTYPLYDALKQLKVGNPRIKVILRADENTEYQFLQPVLAECTRAGVNYDFATQKGEAPPQ